MVDPFPKVLPRRNPGTGELTPAQELRPAVVDVAYIEFVQAHPCCACGASAPSEAHHWEPKGSKGMSQRTDDYRAVPLCHECHIEKWHRHGSVFRVHAVVSNDGRRRTEELFLRMQVNLLVEWCKRHGARARRKGKARQVGNEHEEDPGLRNLAVRISKLVHTVHQEGMGEARVGTMPGSGIPLPDPPFGMSDGEAREAARVRAESFCACGRRLPECDGSRAGCLGSTGEPGVRDKRSES